MYENSDARRDRNAWLLHKPYRHMSTMAFAMVEAMLKVKVKSPITERISMHVRTMK